MLPQACFLYDDFALRFRDPTSGEWRDYEDVLWMREQSLGAICDLFLGEQMEVAALADGIRVVNSDRLEADCRSRNLPVRHFRTIRSVGEREGVLDRDFYSVGFGPGMLWRYA